MTLTCLLAAVLTGAVAPAGALGFERIEAAFLSEYSATSYTIDQGEIVTFGNGDKFLRHGVLSDDGTSFSAPVIALGQVRLLRGAPFLTSAGSPYTFHCPLHPAMKSQLIVTSAGAPLPPDSAQPGAALKITTGSVGRVVKSHKVRVVVNPSEAVDAVIKVGAGGTQLGRAERTYLTPGRRAITLGFPRAAAKAVERAAAKGPVSLRLKVTLADVAGNVATVKRTRRLAGAPRKPKKKQKS